MPKKIGFVFLEILFLTLIYASGLYFRLVPRLEQDPHLLTFEADIWYRLTMAQNLLDHGHLPEDDIRYQAYGKVPPPDVSASDRSQSDPLHGLTPGGGKVPFWYPPLSLHFLAGLAKTFGQDLPTVSSRIIPFFEAIAPLSTYVFCRFLLGRGAAILATLFLALIPSFVFWTGICDPQSFILFMIPIILLLWIKHAEWSLVPENRLGWRIARILLLGGLLSLCFLTHLFFFIIPFLLLLVTMGLLMEQRTRLQIFIDLVSILGLSQILTVGWWGPKNLYWWWLMSLVTSSGHYPTEKQIADFGTLATIVGSYFLLLILIKALFPRKNPIKYAWVFILWTVLPLFETQNENILMGLGRLDLSWSTLFKPLEGFRFYCFLAQPIAIIFGMMVMHFATSSEEGISKGKRNMLLLFIPLLLAFLVYDIHVGYRFNARIRNSGFNLEEIRAAQWFRQHSRPTDRIIADYYRAQMFAGFSGGKALLGMAFPLKRVDFPYISQKNYTVPEDVYRIYTTDDPAEAVELMKRYGATHLLISANMGSTGNFITKGFGVSCNFKTLQDTKYFRPVYQKEGEVVILERVV